MGLIVDSVPLFFENFFKKQGITLFVEEMTIRRDILLRRSEVHQLP